MNIFDKILYGIKAANDNIIIINDKMDDIIKMFSYDKKKNIRIGRVIDRVVEELYNKHCNEEIGNL